MLKIAALTRSVVGLAPGETVPLNRRPLASPATTRIRFLMGYLNIMSRIFLSCRESGFDHFGVGPTLSAGLLLSLSYTINSGYSRKEPRDQGYSRENSNGFRLLGATKPTKAAQGGYVKVDAHL